MKVSKITPNTESYQRQVPPRNLYLSQWRKADMKMMKKVIQDFGRKSVFEVVKEGGKEGVKDFFKQLVKK